MPYAIINSVCAQVYSKDIPGAGGKWFESEADAQAACDEWNAAHPRPVYEQEPVE